MRLEGLVSLFCFAGSSFLLAGNLLPRRTGSPRLPAAIPAFFLCLFGQIVLAAYVLSAFGALGSLAGWTAGSIALLGTAALWTRFRPGAPAAGGAVGAAPAGPKVLPPHRQDPPPNREDRATNPANPLPPREGGVHPAARIRLGALAAAVALCGALNLGVVILCAPGTWDAMSYHLARMAFYLQQGGFAPYDADYWAQIVHPVNSTALALYAFLVTGRENLTQAVQFLSYWAAIAAVYGIAGTVGLSRRAGLFAALVFGLLTICLMEASTAQNDLFQAACLGAALYFILSWKRAPAASKLILCGAALGLALGTKASALLALPALGIAAFFSPAPGGPVSGTALFLGRFAPARRNGKARGGAAAGKGGPGRPGRRRPRTVLSLLTLLGAAALFIMPAGYVRNMRLFGHPVAPPPVRAEHTFEGHGTVDTLVEGTRNVLRYAVSFLSLDGIPPGRAADRAQALLRFLPSAILRPAGLEEARGAREPFSLSSLPACNEDEAFFGILGFALVLPLGLLVLLGVLRPPGGRALAAAGLAFFLTQAFAGPFDPWRGRYFIFLGILLAVPAGYYLAEGRGRLWNAYSTAVVLAGCLAAPAGILFHDTRPLLPPAASVLRKSRIEQLAAARPKYLHALERFEDIVPPQATVAICLWPNSYEYPLFGAGLTRRIVSINSFMEGIEPIPPEAEFLLYEHRKIRPNPFYSPGDLRLGKDWYLKRLKGPKSVAVPRNRGKEGIPPAKAPGPLDAVLSKRMKR